MMGLPACDAIEFEETLLAPVDPEKEEFPLDTRRDPPVETRRKSPGRLVSEEPKEGLERDALTGPAVDGAVSICIAFAASLAEEKLKGEVLVGAA